MTLLSPRNLNLPPRTLTAFSEFDFEYLENDGLGLTQHGKIPTLIIGTETLPVGGSARIEIPHYRPTEATTREFLKIQRLVNTCVNNAEDIKRELHSVAEFIFRSKPDLLKASATYDFMKLKDTFADYMKKDDKTRHLANKALRRDFNQFVIDRNTYTHGKLAIRNGDGAFIIVYQDNSTKIKTYAIVDSTIIQSFYTTYVTLRQLIREFRRLATT